MNGFTLVECLIILAFLGILLSSAIGSLTHLYQAYEAEAIVDSLVQDLQFARQQALSQHTSIVLCPSSNEQTCNETEWDKGYIILENTQKIFSRKINAKGKLSNSRSFINFDAEGRAEVSNSTFIYITSYKTYKVIINRQGRIRVE